MQRSPLTTESSPQQRPWRRFAIVGSLLLGACGYSSSASESLSEGPVYAESVWEQLPFVDSAAETINNSNINTTPSKSSGNMFDPGEPDTDSSAPIDELVKAERLSEIPVPIKRVVGLGDSIFKGAYLHDDDRFFSIIGDDIKRSETLSGIVSEDLAEHGQSVATPTSHTVNFLESTSSKASKASMLTHISAELSDRSEEEKKHTLIFAVLSNNDLYEDLGLSPDARVQVSVNNAIEVHQKLVSIGYSEKNIIMLPPPPITNAWSEIQGYIGRPHVLYMTEQYRHELAKLPFMTQIDYDKILDTDGLPGADPRFFDGIVNDSVFMGPDGLHYDKDGNEVLYGMYAPRILLALANSRSINNTND